MDKTAMNESANKLDKARLAAAPDKPNEHPFPDTSTKVTKRQPAKHTAKRPGTRPGKRPAKRTDSVAQTLKEWIVDKGLHPGARLPQEKDLTEIFKASKSTIREALKSLEAQGLLRIRSGPGGGAFIAEVHENHAIELLGNYFFFQSISIHEIYELRKVLEPKLAASLVDHFSNSDIALLRNVMTYYDKPAENIAQEREQRSKELQFHICLTQLCPNPLLAFMCRFLIRLLMDLTICKKIYDSPNPELRETGLTYQSRLLEALIDGDRDKAHDIMYDHMCTAQILMEKQEASVQKQFLNSFAAT